MAECLRHHDNPFEYLYSVLREHFESLEKGKGKTNTNVGIILKTKNFILVALVSEFPLPTFQLCDCRFEPF